MALLAAGEDKSRWLVFEEAADPGARPAGFDLLRQSKNVRGLYNFGRLLLQSGHVLPGGWIPQPGTDLHTSKCALDGVDLMADHILPQKAPMLLDEGSGQLAVHVRVLFKTGSNATQTARQTAGYLP